MVATAIPIETIPSIDPATGRILAQFEKTPLAALPEVLSRARAAQGIWRYVTLKKRCAQLRVLRDCMMASRDALADAVVAESGKPRAEAFFADLFVALDTAQYFSNSGAKLLRSERVPHHSSAAKAKSGQLVYEPVGVIGIISSWNYPLAIPLSQIIPAVAAGNSVVCKASDLTPHCGALIEKLFFDAGFPKNLVTVLQGGGEVGEALIDAAPGKILFTGSVATGRRVAEACAKKLIPSVLELGGKDAMIVLADANLEMAASAAVWGSYTNCGQVCLSIERVFVEEAVEKKFVALCIEKTKKLRLGPGCDPTSDVGPLIRPEHVQRMSDLITQAVGRGARVLCGGKARPDLGANFFEPTIIAGVNSSMRLFREETFGPIVVIRSARDAAQAVYLANETTFSLAASVWTSNVKRGRAVAADLHAGAVMINDAISYFGIAEAPHGGCGASGWGRTHGRAGLHEMVNAKYIDVDRMPGREKPWWYRYGPGLDKAADAFLKFEFGGSVAAKLRNIRGAMKTMFRDHDL